MDREFDRGSSEAGSGSATPRSLDQENLRCDTPGTMPTHMYSAEELYELEKAPASQVIPDCLEKEFIADGIWDPERWVRSFGGGGGGSASGSRGGSRGPSPQATETAKPFRRNSASERPVDPKERIAKEEKDGIVLSPQRRSFGTGCHVSSTQPLLQRALSNLESDRDRREPRRIGSGRIQIDRDRDRSTRERTDTDFRNDRNERHHEKDPRDFRNVREIDRDRDRDPRDRDLRDRDTRDPRDLRDRDSRDLRERDPRDRDFRNPRDRFERDDRDNRGFNRDRGDRDRGFSRRDNDDRGMHSRDFRDFRSNRRPHHRQEEEPEWFSGGPVSKSDTIELHGFERERRDTNSVERDRREETERDRREEFERERREIRRRANNATDHQMLEEKEDVILQDRETSVASDDDKENEGISVADRNGSLETNESSSPETNPTDMDMRPGKSQNAHGVPSFDFNEFFNIDNIPGLSTSDESLTEADMATLGGSRFYQLYRNQAAAAANATANQQHRHGKPSSRENSRRSSMIEDEFGYLNDLLNGSRSPVMPSPPDGERASFLSPFASSDKQHHLEFGTVGQKFGGANNNTLVTALINNATAMERNRSSPTGMKNSPQDTEAKLKALLFGRIDSQSSSGNTTPGFNSPMNVPGKVKTVAELEDELQKAQRTRRGSTPPGFPLPRGSPQASNDLTAFNKLISLMQAGAARPVESPKLPIKAEQRAPSPLSSLPPHLQPAHLQQQATPPHLQATPTPQPPVNHQHHGLPPQMPHPQMQPGLSQHQQQGMPHPTPQGVPPPHQTAGIPQQPPMQHQTSQGLPPHQQQGRIIHKPEPLDIHAQQNQRGSLDEIQFDMMDSYPGNITTPTSVAPPINLNDASAAQKQFLEALQRNKEQQLQIRQATIQSMRLQHHNVMATPGQPSVMSSPGQTNMTPQASLPAAIHQQQTPSHNAQQPITSVSGRRSSNGDPIMSFLKANPTIITKPASPTPPPQQTPTSAVTMVNYVQQMAQPVPGASPRGPSPSPVLQSALLSRQAPGTPRVPSPIMFSQQPPMHLSAPSPIHPVQGGSLSQSPISQPTSTSANSIRPPPVPRVPSPQELIVHTQAILQNALIKKQLEDQKERFYKKQQERVKSPNPMPGIGGKAMTEMSSMNNVMPLVMPVSPIAMTSTPARTAVNVAFTPTSVIRKMHSEKANEKEKQRRDSMDTEGLEHVRGIEEQQVDGFTLLDQPDSLLALHQQHSPSSARLHDLQHPPPATGNPGGNPALHHQQHHHPSSQPSVSTTAHPPPPAGSGSLSSSIPPPAVIHTVPPPPLPSQVLQPPNMVSVLPPGVGPTVGASVIPGLPPTFNTNQLQHLPPPPTLVSTHLPPPLLSPGGVGVLAPPPTHPQNAASLIKQEQIDALKSQQFRALIGQHSPNAQSSGMSVVTSSLPISGRPIVKGNAVSPSSVMKDMSVRPPVGSSTPVSAVDIAKMLQRQQLSSSPHVPRAQGTPTSLYGGIPIATMSPYQQIANLPGQPRMLDPRALRGQLPQGIVPSLAPNQPFNPRTLNPPMGPQSNGPISPVQMPVSMMSMSNSGKPDNLMKWFGTDMLKTSLPTMPPLPVQGQRVLTLDEIERL